MAKPFGESKRPSNWLRYKEAQDYLRVLSEALKRASTDLLIVRKGGNTQYQGIWCTDYRIAMRFAQWLSPEFSLMIDTLLVKLLTKQVTITELKPTAFDLLSKKLEDRYVRRPEFNESVEIINSAILACGSANQLASRIGISGATLSLLKSRPWLVSTENLHGIELACRNLLSRDAKLDTETFGQILMIKDCDLRISIFDKMKKGGLI
jgi:DNA-binding Xre family transcriptional regulator